MWQYGRSEDILRGVTLGASRCDFIQIDNSQVCCPMFLVPDGVKSYIIKLTVVGGKCPVFANRSLYSI